MNLPPRRELAEVEVRSQRRMAIEKLRFRALHDDLTGLANRNMFTRFLDQALARYRRRRQGCFAVLFLDLDSFKVINDTHGHLVGDQFLLIIAARLEASLRPGDVIARFGGDEFIILLDDIQDANDIPEIAQALQETVAQPVDVGGHQFFTTASTSRRDNSITSTSLRISSRLSRAIPSRRECCA